MDGSPCIPGVGGSNGNGYVKIDGRLAHRLAYERAFGPIPPGMQIDHLCRNRACINPSHLEAVTPRENTLRGLRGRLITHCPSGHPYDEINTLHRANGHRRCRTCHAAQERRRAARARAA